jgi:hypothetical protein
LFNEETILADDDAFFVSDGRKRPSHWFQAMIPQHPIAFFTILEILNRIAALENVSRMKPVFVTGPDALRTGYGNFLSWQEGIFNEETTFTGKFGKKTRKICKDVREYVIGSLGSSFADIVQWNETNVETGEVTAINITRRERTERESGVLHWVKAYKKSNKENKVSCFAQLLVA